MWTILSHFVHCCDEYAKIASIQMAEIEYYIYISYEMAITSPHIQMPMIKEDSGKAAATNFCHLHKYFKVKSIWIVIMSNSCHVFENLQQKIFAKVKIRFVFFSSAVCVWVIYMRAIRWKNFATAIERFISHGESLLMWIFPLANQQQRNGGDFVQKCHLNCNVAVAFNHP